jgi:hypothetical protein
VKSVNYFTEELLNIYLFKRATRPDQEDQTDKGGVLVTAHMDPFRDRHNGATL